MYKHPLLEIDRENREELSLYDLITESIQCGCLGMKKAASYRAK